MLCFVVKINSIYFFHQLHWIYNQNFANKRGEKVAVKINLNLFTMSFKNILLRITFLVELLGDQFFGRATH